MVIERVEHFCRGRTDFEPRCGTFLLGETQDKTFVFAAGCLWTLVFLRVEQVCLLRHREIVYLVELIRVAALLQGADRDYAVFLTPTYVRLPVGDQQGRILVRCLWLLDGRLEGRIRQIFLGLISRAQSIVND